MSNNNTSRNKLLLARIKKLKLKIDSLINEGVKCCHPYTECINSFEKDSDGVYLTECKACGKKFK